MSDTDSLLQFPTAAPDAAAGESSDSMTFGMLGILLFLDTCFVANYYIVRSLRRCTDAHAKTLPAEKDFGNSAKASPAGAFVEKFIFGLLMGKVKPIPLSIQKFPEWKPIKYKAQVFLTGFFVLISLAILNPDAFAGDADVGGLTLDAEFCKPFDRQNGLDELRQEVFTVTNYNDSVLQWRHMWFFQQALLNDTSRYGEDAFSCVDTAEVTKTTHADGSTTEVENKFISGKKKNWVDITEFPAVEFGSFFPGYCSAAREAAKMSALNVKCTDEKCACPRIPSTGFTRFFGIDGNEVCSMRICLSSPMACPGHTNDVAVNTDNYREAQLDATVEDPGNPTVDAFKPEVNEEAQEAAQAGITLLLSQIDMAANFYSIYTVVALFFPTPLVVFRLPYWIAIKRFLFGADQNWFIFVFVSSIWIYTYLHDFITDPDFMASLANFVQGDPCLLDPKYTHDRYAIINDICDKLVPLLPDFELKKKTIPTMLNEINEFAQPACESCKFPMHDLYKYRIENFPESMVGGWGFTELSPNHMCDKKSRRCNVLFPTEETEFIGNRTLCLSEEDMRAMAVKAPSTEFDFESMANLWISSGLLASFLVKIAMSNFSVGLMLLADPFVTCSGEFLWIPTQLGSGLGGRDKNEVFRGFKSNKLGTLRNLYMRSNLIWGTIFHWCLYSLTATAFAAAGKDVEVSDTDVLILSVTLAGSAIVIILSCCWRAVLWRKTRRFNARSGAKSGGKTGADTYGDESSDDYNSEDDDESDDDEPDDDEPDVDESDDDESEDDESESDQK